MENKFLKQLNKHIAQTQAFDRHRKYWLMASAFVIAVIVSIVYEWEFIIHAKILWLIASLGMTMTAIWWYWTMRFVRHLIEIKTEESKMLVYIIQDVQYIHKEILKSLREENKSVK